MTPSEEIRSLKKQLNKERRKNRLLREKLERRGIHASDLGEDAPDTFVARAREAGLFRHKGYIGYLAALIRGNSFYRLWEKYVGYFRRLGLVSVTLRILTYLLFLVQTGTVFFIVVLLFLFALPILAAIAIGTYLVALLLMRHDNYKMQKICSCDNVYIFFPSRSQEFSRGNFWRENILSFSQREKANVLVVSPYFLSGKGLWENNPFYFNFRRETDRVYLIRKHYFFSLRHHVLSTCGARITLIY